MTEVPAVARVTYREVLGVREFRAIVGAQALSVIGDQLARLAIAVLVFQRTGSAFFASATYACSFLTWVVGGPLLSALADRYPRHSIMIFTDLARAVLLLGLAVPGMPLYGLFGLLLVASALAPPFEAARSALVTEVLDDRQYVAGNAIMNSVFTLGQVAGFGVGGLVIAGIGVRASLVLDAASFLLSAALLILLVARRPSPQSGPRTSLWSETKLGIRLVAGDPELRGLLTLGVLGMCTVITAEGLAVPTAEAYGGGPATAGLLIAAIPAGYVVGAALAVRVPLARRDRTMWSLLLLSGLPLLASPWVADVALLALLWAVSGMGSSMQILANSAFVVATPPQFRARAFGVAATVIMGSQGIVLLAAGAAAELLDSRVVVAANAAVFLALSLLLRPRRRMSQGNVLIVRGVQG